MGEPRRLSVMISKINRRFNLKFYLLDTLNRANQASAIPLFMDFDWRSV
jgi:hypothetical protein